jgi:DNA-binding winged helix-turn-helix (wHTH) protein/tetratricopeptide (TPR) repeat protein
MESQQTEGYEFGPFQLLPNERLLLRDGNPVALTPKVFDTLLVFVENSGRLLSKDELMKLIWPDATVEEGNLSQNIFVLRKTLGENPPRERYIVTIPLQGYRFIAKVKELRQGDETAGASQTKTSPVTSLAVLPFKLLGDERDDDRHLGAGIADALVTKLSRIGRIIVRPTTTVLKYSAQRQDPLVAGREQSVDAVLDGVVQRLGPRIRVGVQLIRVDRQETIWGDQFEENFTDIFALQDSISEHVARLLVPQLSREDRDQLFKNHTDNVEAYALYIKGRYFWDQRTEEGFRKGLESAQAMIRLDPGFAMAHVGLADSYNLMGEYLYLAPAESFPKARIAAAEALRLDASLSEAHASLAEVALFFDWDWSKAEQEYQRAIALNPHYATAHHWYAWFLLTLGRFEEARASLRRAQALDPGSLTINTVMGLPDYYERHYDRAISQYERMLQLNPDFRQIHYYLGSALVQKGLHAAAVTEFKSVAPNQQSEALLGYTYGVMGEKKLALDMIDRLNALSKQRYVSSYLKAIVYTGLGEIDEAFAQLENAYAEHASWMVFLRVDPFLDPLRLDQRFTDLLRRVRLVP